MLWQSFQGSEKQKKGRQTRPSASLQHRDLNNDERVLSSCKVGQCWHRMESQEVGSQPRIGLLESILRS